MTEIIDVHSHLLNFKFIPDSFFKTRLPFQERFIRSRLTRWLVHIWAALPFPKEGDLFYQYLKIMKLDIDQVAEVMKKEMEAAGISLTIPNMMDLEVASFGIPPETPYRVQVQCLSDIARANPGLIMPFIMFDPRRENAGKLVTDALERYGFLGVKMYPPLGYHPDPDSIMNEPRDNDELRAVYQYCDKENVPITTHCSSKGAYGSAVMRSKESIPKLTHPSAWLGVAKAYKGLRLNLAHSGGPWTQLERRTKKKTCWRQEVIELMKACPNVYADMSYHDDAFKRISRRAYHEVLKEVMDDDSLKNRVMFGTDWPMIRHNWTMAKYTRKYLKGMDEEIVRTITFDNPLQFLFVGKLPQRLRVFYGDRLDAMPHWLREVLGEAQG